MNEKFISLYNRLIKTITVNENDYIVCAISGGSDSMCLLSILIKLKREFNLNIVCAHVNHNVRKESDSELLFVKDYCEKNDVIFESMKINQKIEGNFESGARKIRYNFFQSIINKYNAKCLFTAHHGDDLMETILMRIVRGSNIKGYSGFNYISKMNNYYIVRPLISITKDDIINYNQKNSIPWVEDYTNHTDEHTRNRYRKYILPKLKQENNNVNLKFLQFSEELEKYNNYIERIALDKYDKMYSNKIIVSNLIHEDKIIQDRIIYIYLEKIYNDNIYMINNQHILNIYNMLSNKKPNLSLNMPNNMILVKAYDEIKIIPIKEMNEYCFIFNEKKIELPNKKIIEQIDSTESNSNYYCKLDFSDVKLPLIIRTRKDGDKIFIKNMNGSKKIKDIFIDSKISLSERNNWPIVTDSNDNIVWLPGIKKSKYDKQNNEKYDIILKYY